jgi:hypothetical protein
MRHVFFSRIKEYSYFLEHKLSQNEHGITDSALGKGNKKPEFSLVKMKL